MNAEANGEGEEKNYATMTREELQDAYLKCSRAAREEREMHLRTADYLLPFVTERIRALTASLENDRGIGQMERQKMLFEREGLSTFEDTVKKWLNRPIPE